jgi:hypothetical protein
MEDVINFSGHKVIKGRGNNNLVNNKDNKEDE